MTRRPVPAGAGAAAPPPPAPATRWARPRRPLLPPRGWPAASALLHAGALAALLLWPAPPPPDGEAGGEGVAIVWRDPTPEAGAGDPAAGAPEGAEAPAPPETSAAPPATAPPPEAPPVAAEALPPPETAAPVPGAVVPAAPPDPAMADLPRAPSSPAPAPPPSAPAEAPLPLPLRPPPPPPPSPAPRAPAQATAAPPPLGLPGATGAQPTPAAGRGLATGAVATPATLSEGAANAPPGYPEGSRRRGETGTVRLSARVADDGHVVQVRVVESSGFPDLDEAARLAVRRWRFRPATRDGAPVFSTVAVPVTFQLQTRGESGRW